MGDNETSAEEDKEKDMLMALLCPPVYSLPEEILKMEHNETVCHYCGISYLIFHEFHQLKTKLAQMEAELKDLRGTAEREKAQREALELGRLEWEKALHLDAQRRAEVRDRCLKEELEEKHRETERAMKEVFERRSLRRMREMEEECQKAIEEKERRLRGELGEMEAVKLEKQREELEKKSEEREKVLSDALQKANKKSDELRKYLQQLEERDVCVQQQQALRATLSTLRSSGCKLTELREFLNQMTAAWKVFKYQILQQCTQVFSELREELANSSVELQKMREEKDHLAQQMMEHGRQTEEQLSQKEKEHREKLRRLKASLEEKQESWLSCQRRCECLKEQLSSWQHKKEEMDRKNCAAEEEVTKLKKDLEKLQQDTTELRREKELLKESHGRALIKIEEDCRHQLASKLAAALEDQRTQNALHLTEQRESLRMELEIELKIDREKNCLLALQYQREGTQLQRKVEEREEEVRQLQEDLQQEKRSREEERRKMEKELQQEKRSREEERRKMEKELQQEKRSREEERRKMGEELQQEAKAQLQQMTERTAELEHEVALLQETVQRECEEREMLTAALSQAQQQLLQLHLPVPHLGSSSSPLCALDRRTSAGNKNFHIPSQARVPLTHSLSSLNTARADKRVTDGGGAGILESWNHGRVLNGEKRQEGTLPRLRAKSTMSDVRHKVSVVLGRKL